MGEVELPKRFVAYLRTLFNILDTDESGYVRIVDIETRWQVDGAEELGLPSGVLESLRKVTPLSGKLSFERFVAGLKITLLQRHSNKNNNALNEPQESLILPKMGPTATVPPNNAKQTRPFVERNVEKQRRLQNALSEPALNVEPNQLQGGLEWSRRPQSSSALNKIKDVVETKEQSRSSDDLLSQGTSNKVSVRRTESRRHTLTNGIDFNMIKRIKQWEQERDILLSGVSVIDNVREWYLNRLSEVEQKQKYVATPSQDESTDGQQERLHFDISRIREINQLINSLTDGSSFPSHINLAGPSKQTNVDAESNLIKMLKEQNHLLTQESAEKSDKISQLEKEKAQLILEIFKASSGNTLRNYDDTTFI